MIKRNRAPLYGAFGDLNENYVDFFQLIEGSAGAQTCQSLPSTLNPFQFQAYYVKMFVTQGMDNQPYFCYGSTPAP